MQLYRTKRNDDPDSRPPARGRLTRYLPASAIADPVQFARQQAEEHEQKREYYGRKSASAALKETAHAEFARVWRNYADAAERHRRNWAA